MRSRLTYANVISTLCLFLLLVGGTAFAATKLGKNTVGTKQLEKNSVTAAKIKKGTITGAQVANGSLTGTQIAASTLGTVPNATHAGTASDASTLQGTGASGFMRGGGQFVSARRNLVIGESGVPLIELPGLAEVTAVCAAGTTYPEGRFDIINNSGNTIEQTLQYSAGVDGGTIPNGQTAGIGFNEYVGAWTVQLSTDATPSTVATVNLSFLKDGNSGCFMFGQATVAGG